MMTKKEMLVKKKQMAKKPMKKDTSMGDAMKKQMMSVSNMTMNGLFPKPPMK